MIITLLFKFMAEISTGNRRMNTQDKPADKCFYNNVSFNNVNNSLETPWRDVSSK